MNYFLQPKLINISTSISIDDRSTKSKLKSISYLPKKKGERDGRSTKYNIYFKICDSSSKSSLNGI